jgi:uncharacterized protein YybS (DUF2232 family)
MIQKNDFYKDGLMVLIALFFLTILSSFPILGFLVYFIWPIPLVYLIVKHDIPKAMLIIIISAVLNGILLGIGMGMYTVAGFGLIGFALGSAIKEGFSPLKTLLITIVAVILSDFILIGVAPFVLNFSYTELTQEMLEGIKNYPGLAEYSTIIEQQIKIIEMLYPSMVIITSIVGGVLIYYLALWYLRKRGIKKDAYKPIREWQLPHWPLSLGLVISLLFKGNMIFANLLFVILFLLFLQGFAVGLYYLSRTGSGFLILIYTVISFFFSYIVVLVGLVDMWFNLRKLK